MHVLYSRKTASQKRAILSRFSGSASLDQYIALVRGRIDSLLTKEPHNTTALCLFLNILNRLSITENIDSRSQGLFRVPFHAQIEPRLFRANCRDLRLAPY